MLLCLYEQMTSYEMRSSDESSDCCSSEFIIRRTELFLFQQKTAYEMRISDWSSDVCSSDLSRTASIDGSEVREGNLALLGPGGQFEIAAIDDGPAEVMLMGGPALAAPIVRYGPVVTNTPNQMRAALAVFQRGETVTLPTDYADPRSMKRDNVMTTFHSPNG